MKKLIMFFLLATVALTGYSQVKVITPDSQDQYWTILNTVKVGVSKNPHSQMMYHVDSVTSDTTYRVVYYDRESSISTHNVSVWANGTYSNALVRIKLSDIPSRNTFVFEGKNGSYDDLYNALKECFDKPKNTETSIQVGDQVIKVTTMKIVGVKGIQIISKNHQIMYFNKSQFNNLFNK